MLRLRILICLVAVILTRGVAAAGDFNEPPPSNLGQLTQVHLWATYYDVRDSAKAAKGAPFGLGAFGHQLVPFRTIAADRRVFTAGTVFFIPGLVGMRFEVSGSSRVHDGYVFFADTGRAVRGHHIDFFTGPSLKNPAPDLITSTRRNGFDAYIVTDQVLIERLRGPHVRGD